MFFELLVFEGFSKWVGQVLLSVDLLNLDVTSIHDLSYKVIVKQSVFGSLVG